MTAPPPDNLRLRRGAGFDDHIDAAWRTYRIALGDALAGLTDDTTLRIALCGDSAPLFTATLTGTRRIRIHVHSSTLTGETDRTAVEQLETRGWRTLSDGTTIAEAGRRHADHLAGLAVAALRGLWDVVDPAFLDPLDSAGDGVSAGVGHDPPEPTFEVAAIPTGTEDLLCRTRSAIVQTTGHHPRPAVTPWWI
ncbi:hypothetical protein QSJ19_15420 [Gordonia sp. ABSL11-1]|uniref:TY-Chap domain-containing protein n=1 Tax=Gordonia sp. ABSL11-1 TaxID=3053924 RepID=UPI0025743F9B|nr:hypothetical protein [Gordonia sp. ABSL11-1]MDL9946953.1 hypothetical protein [Gordonia sp. ABSL11-1]